MSSPEPSRILWVAATPPELACAPRRPGASYLVTGCGPAAAAAELGLELGRRGLPDLVIGVGIAGAFVEADLALGTVVRVSREGFADLGCQDGEEFIDLWSLGFSPTGVEREYPLASPAWLGSLTSVIGTTCSVVTGSALAARQRLRRTGADVESMEGAAWAHVCWRAGVAFAQVRSVSNLVGPRDRASWRIPEALGALTRSLEAACPSI